MLCPRKQRFSAPSFLASGRRSLAVQRSHHGDRYEGSKIPGADNLREGFPTYRRGRSGNEEAFALPVVLKGHVIKVRLTQCNNGRGVQQC